MKQIILTPEQKEIFKNCYIINEEFNSMKAIGNVEELTAENFKAFWLVDECNFQELTVEDFEWYNPENDDYDFKVDEEKETLVWVDREEIPEEVRELLDAEIKKRNSIESEDDESNA